MNAGIGSVAEGVIHFKFESDITLLLGIYTDNKKLLILWTYFHRKNTLNPPQNTEK